MLTAALEVFREVRCRQSELRGRVQESLAESHAGEATPLDMDEIRQSLTNRLYIHQSSGSLEIALKELGRIDAKARQYANHPKMTLVRRWHH